MQRIIPLELLGKENLDYNLYNENNELIYEKGEQLTPELMLMLNYKKLYRDPNETYDDIEYMEVEETKEAESKDDIETEEEALPEPEPIIDDFELDNLQNTSEIKNVNVITTPRAKKITSSISEKATQSLITNSRKIIQQTYESETPDISVCEATRDTLLEEVVEKIEKIDCIGQLRIFDEYTFSHTINVSSMCSALGVTLGFSDKDLKDLALGALLHDIGKMKVPKTILNKPAKLTEEEFNFMKAHTSLGYEVVKNEMNLSERIALIALQHQEKYGGQGYPHGLKGKEISLFAQVTSIVDVYDALVSKRVYKEAMASHEAIKIMLKEGSRSFNPFMLFKFIYLANYKNAVDIQITEEDKIDTSEIDTTY